MSQTGRRLGEEPISTSVHRLDEARPASVIPESVAEFLDAGGQSRLADHRIRPGSTDDLLLRDDLSRALREDAQQRQRLRRQPYDLPATHETLLGVEPVTTEADRPEALRRLRTRRWREERSVDVSQLPPASGLEDHPEVPGGVEPPSGLLLQTAVDDLPDPRGDAGRQGLGIGVENGVAAFHERARGEGPPSAEHLVDRRTQAEEVGPGVDRIPPNLLRRHVARGAEDQSGAGGSDRGRQRLVHQRMWRGLSLHRLDQLGDAEVEQLHVAALGKEKILRLEVAVDDAALERRR